MKTSDNFKYIILRTIKSATKNHVSAVLFEILMIYCTFVVEDASKKWEFII
jgi:hypothetical protein